MSALVVAASDGRELYARSAERALVPASNQKILTALAALSAFGPAHRFRTALLADRALDASGTLGTLYVVGGGDPGLDDQHWWRLAADLRALGLRRVRDVVLDDSRFERTRWHPSWGALSSRAYHAPVGALGANYGAFTAWVQAGARSGEPVSVRLDPPVPYLELVNRARTAPRGAPFRFQVERQEGGASERVVVTGSLPAGSPAQPVARSVADPTRYAGAVFRMQLEAVGIELAGEVRVAPAPAGAAHVYDYYGPSVAEVLVPVPQVEPQRGRRDAVQGPRARARRRRGGAGRKAPQALRGELARLGLTEGSLVVVDGSGLSYQNRASPRTLVDALRLAQTRFELGPELEAGLPIAGTDGTLRRRAAGARGFVRAKTGLLTQVAALSGYAQAPGGEERVFSVLVNGFRGDARGAMRALDAFAEVLAGPR